MNYYTNKFLLKDAAWTAEHKELSTLEKIGLEKILCDFVKEYELETFGETYCNLEDYTRYNEKSVDILDGYHDTYIFNNYAIGEIYACGGAILLSCADLSQYIGDDPEEFEERKDDPADLVNHFDIWCDFETVVFRLN